jgi:hypothetical protein
LFNLREIAATLLEGSARPFDGGLTNTVAASHDEGQCTPRWLGLLRLGLAAVVLAGLAWSMSHMPARRAPDLSCSDVGDPFGPKLTLLATVIDSHHAVNDFCVFHDGRSIGRIRKNTEGHGHDAGWDWAINTPLAMPAWGHGSAPSLPEAKAAFAGAWERFYADLTPDDITHWHRLQDEARASYQHGN